MSDDTNSTDVAAPSPTPAPERQRPPTLAEIRAARKAHIENDPFVKKNNGWVDRTLAALDFDGIESADENDRAEIEALMYKRREERNTRMSTSEINLAHKYAVKCGIVPARG